MNQSERIQRFVETLREWYRTHRRELPWRDLWSLDRDDRAYRVLLSEVMLQQTQVSRVIGSYKKFIQQFPDVHALAAATNGEVLIAWRGMGYNSRALRLRDGARAVSVFPQSMEELMAINGIGAYTAGAICTFAFDLPTPVIDTNIRRILHRTFIGPENADGTWKVDDKKLGALMGEIMDAWIAAGHRGSDLLSALMDYGSLVQTKTSPKWDVCPLTAEGIMKTTKKSFELRAARREKDSQLMSRVSRRSEPGRLVGSKFIPNRIFRGRIVETLRDHPNGLKLEEIGKWISPDYSVKLRPWLKELIKKLAHEEMIRLKGGKFLLAE